MVEKGYKDTEVGVIPIEWDVVSLGDVLEYEQPTKYLVETTDYDNSYSTPVLTAGKSFILGYTNERSGIYENLPAIIFDDFTTASKYVDFPFKAKSSAMKILKVRNKEYPTNLFYEYLNSVEFEAGTHKRYWISEYQNLKIPLPPLKEQEKIADILSTADDKIDAIAIQIEKAETLKKGLLQKLLSEGIGHSEFKDSELGKIPASWEVGKLEDILTIKYGKSQKDVEDINGDYPILGTGGIMGYANNYLCNKPSVLIGRKGTIDKPQYMETPFWTVDTLFYTELKKGIHPKFVYYIFQTIPWKKYNEASGVPSLSKPNIHNIATVLLTFEEQKQIAEILSTADGKLEVLRAKKEKYETLKKGLLQKLLSGEVRV